MRWLAALVTLSLIAVAIPLAGTAGATHPNCESVALSPPAGPPVGDLGSAWLCDTSGDGAPDTLKVDTFTVPSSTEASVTRSNGAPSDRPHEQVRVELLASAGGPLDPMVSSETGADDDGDDEQLNRVYNQGTVHLDGPADESLSYFVGLWDFTGDGVPETWGFLFCAADGCRAPSPSDLLEVVSQPEPRVYVSPVGWVP